MDKCDEKKKYPVYRIGDERLVDCGNAVDLDAAKIVAREYAEDKGLDDGHRWTFIFGHDVFCITCRTEVTYEVVEDV